MKTDILKGLSLTGQIACVEREIALRKAAYPAMVQRKQMRESVAQAELDVMEGVLQTMQWFAGRETMLRAAVDAADPNPPSAPASNLVGQIDCVRREITKRNAAYPGFLSRGTMREADAAYEVAAMEQVLATLQWLRRNETTIRAAIAAVKAAARSPEKPGIES